MKRLWLVTLVLGFSLALGEVRPALAQTATPAPVAIRFTVLDKNQQPLVGIKLTLTLFRYGAGVEELPGGGCTTDAKGVCQIDVADAPRLWDGRAEASVQVGAYGKKTIGWEGDTAEITILVGDLGLLATLSAPLDRPYETPGASTGTPTSAAPATLTIIPTKTPTRVPLTMTATSTLVPPTPTAEPTVTPQPTPAPKPRPNPSRPVGLIFILVGLVLLSLLAYRVWQQYRPRR